MQMTATIKTLKFVLSVLISSIYTRDLLHFDNDLALWDRPNIVIFLG